MQSFAESALAAGYFTSRPTSKGWIRSSTSFLQAARQLEILTSAGVAQFPTHPFSAMLLSACTHNLASRFSCQAWLYLSTSEPRFKIRMEAGPYIRQQALACSVAASPAAGKSALQSGAGNRELTLTSHLTSAAGRSALQSGAGNRELSTGTLELAVSLLQHHDAITGTEKQHVANDYHRRLAKGAAAAPVIPQAVLCPGCRHHGAITGMETHCVANGLLKRSGGCFQPTFN